MTGVAPRAVLLTRHLPSPTGGGSHMRAWDWVVELAATHHVTVVVTGPEEPVDPALAALAQVGFVRRIKLGGLQPSDVQTTDPEALATLLPPAGETLAVLVVFRMRVLPVGRLVLQRHPVEHRVLDVDDLESRTRASITRAAVRLGMPRGTAKGARATLAYRRLERHDAGGFDVVTVASPTDTDAAWLRRWAPVVEARPNRVPDAVAKPPGPVADPIRLLFVGTLNYLPNEIAVGWLARRLMPALRRDGVAVRLDVVGRRPSPRVRRWAAATPDLHLTADAPDLSAHYAACDAVLVPVRHGGGTKIKVVEAAAHQRPVLGFPAGLRGLPSEPGRDHLEFRTTREAVAAIRRLRDEPGLGARLASSARESLAGLLAAPLEG